ncbi:hypothetical protein [Methanosarcina mazei]|jgi:hypothetical protein|uniref:Uncharacterized protein n=1 Tax=Methanosarcina mazei TaxID=2209 RepID=A0A0F8V269_METMZ|nr:hypothetical protein [Methanosarcina mazei]KKF98700.1 hypothetical protein DU40_00250 [Methanosarcina mazei]KKF99219.1 hypothetical protein DU31_02755 [Methanosarcina mazei]KKG00778.1 hypothetical protein DU47_00800 [Methanosarcina mazei]KKG16633.1 hypothetical protein DU34_05475 [Methanosarcina mazei]KKG31201.1 hypothetical protein DU49_00890 [Methanosarcina mazei]
MEKMKIKVIRSVIVPLLVSALIHIFALSVFIFDIFHILPELFEVLMVLISIFVYPLAPIFYGLQTKDRIGSVIVGTVPILCLFYELHLNSFIAGNVPETERILDIFTYFGSLAIIGGLEGYYASKEQFDSLIIAVVLAIFWISIFLNGLD